MAGGSQGPEDSYFNPRSREGSDHRKRHRRRCILYFNPRSREGSDLWLNPEQPTTPDISIHAPVKGATRAGRTVDPAIVFQSTLP